MIRIHFTAIFWNLKNIFTQKRWGQIVVALAYLTILALLFVFIFVLGVNSFRFLYTFSVVSQPLVSYILLSALAFTSIISVLSFSIALTHRLFERKLAAYFIAPVLPISLFQAVFWENFFLGGWSFLIIALPLLLAYLVVTDASLILYPLLFVLFFLLAILTESIGATLALFSRYYFAKLSKKIIYLFTLTVFLILGIILKNVFLPTGLLEVAERPTLREVFVGLSSLPVASPFLPPALFLDSLTQNFASFLIFTSQTFLLYFLSLRMAEKLYRTAWQGAQEGVFLARPHQMAASAKKAIQFPGGMAGLLKKEFLLLDRSPGLLLYFGFVIFLAIIYFFLLSQSPRSPEFSPAIFPKIASLTVMIIGYFITMVALRFSFPALVAEFRPFWFLSPLPQGREKIMVAKWVAYTLLTSGVAWILAIFAFFILHLQFEFLPHLLGLCLSGALLISAVNLLIGTFWAAKLPRDDVEQTTTALPAVAATLASILIAFFLGLAFYQMMKVSPYGEVVLSSQGEQLVGPAAIFVFSCLAWFLALRLGKSRFSRMDIR